MLRAGIGALIAMGALPAVWAAPAARVEFSVGDVQIVAPSGQARTGRKGVEVNSGETVNTNHGRAQLRFSDGAYVSLQPQSAFRIDDYRFDGKTDGTERGFFSLLKGGLRTLTGLVGHANRKNYQVTTSVATIGIRGTEYTIAYTKSIEGTIGEGEIDVCTGAGCKQFTSGESFHVHDPQSLPQLTFKKTDLPPQQPDDASGGSFGDQNDPGQNPGGSVDVAGDNVGPDGTPAGLILGGTQQLNGVYAAGASYPSYFQPGTVVFDANGVVTDLAGIIPSGSVTQTGNDGIVAWGYFPKVVSAAPGMLAFVTGLPVTNAADLYAGDKVATYSLIPGKNGLTPVVDAATGAPIGNLDSASMTVNFGQNSATAQMGWTVQGGRYAAGLTGSFDGPLYLNGRCNVGSCNVSALGQVFGTNAVRAGIAYQFSSGSTNAVGSAALVQTSLTP